ncbi:hypothetical protein ABFT80_23365 [Mesorhizobium sp. SB112]|uniref:hypothetical protein n=1 Tax=Mesorhizobium sp. SB112 TaxID=3151853 RepID=UPI003263090D
MLKSQRKFPIAVHTHETTALEISTKKAINAAKFKYEDKASLSAAWCAFAARCEGKEDDYRFWLNVFKNLTGKRQAECIEVLTSDTNPETKL